LRNQGGRGKWGEGDITRIRIPNGMREGFGDGMKKGERACIFHRKRWNEEQVGKSGETGEFGPKRSPCPFKM